MSQGPRTIQFLATASLLPRGDGSFVLSPRIKAEDLGEEIDVKTAAAILGVTTREIRALYYNSYILGRKPTPRTILLEKESVLEHRRKTQDDPWFWQGKTLDYDRRQDQEPD